MSQTTHPMTQHEQSDSAIAIHQGDLDTLIDHAAIVQRPTDHIIAPVDLHRRHLKHRVSHASEPLSAFEFSDGASVAARLLESTNRSTQSLDRVDRLDLLEEILAVEDRPREHFEILLGHDPATNVKAVEQTRSEIEAITNYHPTRVGSFRDSLQAVADPVEADARDALYGALAVEGALRRYAEKAPTDTELLRQAARQLVDSGGSVWESVYSNIERVTIIGLSNVSAPLIDLLTAIGRLTDVEAVVWLRPGTGSYLRERLPRTLVNDPGKVFIG